MRICFTLLRIGPIQEDSPFAVSDETTDIDRPNRQKRKKKKKKTNIPKIDLILIGRSLTFYLIIIDVIRVSSESRKNRHFLNINNVQCKNSDILVQFLCS